MKKVIWEISIALFIIASPFVVMAGDFDGSKPLLFAAIEVYEVNPKGCQEIEAGDINLPNFFIIDFTKKSLTPTPESGITEVSKIERMERVDGLLILQGAEDGYQDIRDGLGWTLTIDENTGRAVLSASWRNAAFVIFGVCTPK
ncbi:hypothetical protein ACFL9T_15045 [Thermodesulfobacteriota bacterium]